MAMPIKDMKPLRVRISMPWWCRAYIEFARLNVALGIPINPEKVIDTVTSRIKVKVLP